MYVFFFFFAEQELEYPDVPSTDYNLKAAPANAAEVNDRSLPAHSKAEAEAHCSMLEVGGCTMLLNPECFTYGTPFFGVKATEQKKSCFCC